MKRFHWTTRVMFWITIGVMGGFYLGQSMVKVEPYPFLINGYSQEECESIAFRKMTDIISVIKEMHEVAKIN